MPIGVPWVDGLGGGHISPMCAGSWCLLDGDLFGDQIGGGGHVSYLTFQTMYLRLSTVYYLPIVMTNNCTDSDRFNLQNIDGEF